ncbi:MAG: hypothetical protein KAH96_03195 [Alphaproteobacteria bacterium]|nr:hypothetical protein [Alphaproteobacteria bacterium]
MATWEVYGLLAASLSALMMLMQERMKVDGFSLALWCKVACVITAFPFVLAHGLPSNPMFYFLLGIQALVFTISDVIFYRNIPLVGAGVMSRLMPMTVIFSFFLWFVIKPSEIAAYTATPVISIGILLSLVMTIWFSMRLKKCTVSRQAVRAIWFVLLAGTLGPLNLKVITFYADIEQGPWGYIFIEGWIMIAMWTVWLFVKRPVPPASLLQRRVFIPAIAIGIVQATFLFVMLTGIYNVDNPGYILTLKLLNAVIIIAAHKAMKKKDESDVISGLGIVACAAALIFMKGQM